MIHPPIIGTIEKPAIPLYCGGSNLRGHPVKKRGPGPSCQDHPDFPTLLGDLQPHPGRMVRVLYCIYIYTCYINVSIDGAATAATWCDLHEQRWSHSAEKQNVSSGSGFRP